MKQLYWTFAVTFAAGLALAGHDASAQPQTTTCSGTLAAGTYVDVTVPNGATCTIGAGVTVTGNVNVAPGGSLLTSVGAVINGNIQATNAVTVQVLDAMVGGNIIENGTTSQADVEASTIGGHIQISATTNGSVAVYANGVTGNVLVTMNNLPAVPTSLIIAGNTIGGNLTCAGNTPPPTDVANGVPTPNTVSGNKVGQCAGL